MSQLALQLIEKEKVEKTGYLDIGRCGLTPNNPILREVWIALSNLTHLETLILSNWWSEWWSGYPNESKNSGKDNLLCEIPVELSQLVNLKKLVISGGYDSHTKWKISQIENLPQNIIELYIYNNQLQIVRNLPQTLKKLNVSHNKIYKIEDLPQTLLRLAGITNQIQKIENLPKSIKRLDIEDNKIEKIENLPSSLQRLDIEGNQIQKIRKQKWSKNLEWLDLSNNKIKHIENLPKNLRTLIIGGNQIQRIENLPPDLHEFEIGSSQIKRIENLPKNLQILNILDNQIERLENLPDSLQELNILSNQIQIIENLPPNLRQLDISENQIKDLTPVLSYINNAENDLKEIVTDIYEGARVEQINVAKNPLKHPPLEIVEQGHESTIRYIKELEKFGEAPNDTLKLILVGNTTVGKTSLANYLKNEEFDLTQDSTHGMQIIEWKPKELEGKRINIWDFGGQEYYHATHRLFLSNNAVYILLWDKDTNMTGRLPIPIYIKGSKRQQTIDYDIFPREYWLDSIRYYAEDSEIFVVQNKSKKRPSISEETRRHYNLDNNKEFHICLKKVDEYNKTGQGQRRWSSDYQTLREELINIFKELIDEQPLPAHWIPIRNAILERKENYLSLKRFKEICQEVVEDALIAFDSLIVYLRDIASVVVYCDDNEALKNIVFIKPNWLNGNIYKILDYKVLKKYGRFDMAHVVRKIGSEHAEAFVELMKKFELIFELPDAEGEYIAPQYLEDKCSNELALKMFRESRKLQHAFTLHFTKFLPKSVMTRFLSKYGSKSKVNLFWKYGICFFEEEKGVHVTYERKYVTHNRKEDKIHVEVQDGSKRVAGLIFQKFREITDINFDKNNIKIILGGYPPVFWWDLMRSSRENRWAYMHLIRPDHIDSPMTTEQTDVLSYVDGRFDRIEQILNANHESATRQREYLLEHILINQFQLKEVQEVLKQVVETDIPNIQRFIEIAIQTQDVRNMEEFEAINQGLAQLNKPGSNWEVKAKIGVPLINLIGQELSIETKFDLKKFMKNITEKIDELIVKYIPH